MKCAEFIGHPLLRQEKMDMLMRRSFNRDFKFAVCQEIVSGRLTKSQVCREHGLSPGMLERWVDQYKVLGDSAFPSAGISGVTSSYTDAQRMKELEALVGRQALEIEFLKAAVKKGTELREKGRK